MQRTIISRFPGGLPPFGAAISVGLLCIALLVTGTGILHAQSNWTTSFDGFSTFSSPRVADLNGDGTGDVIIGAGRQEFHACDSSVIALDGVTGKMLWHASSEDQIFGSAGLLDINGDSVPDVVIGGRSASLFALDGKTGATLWRFNRRKNGRKWFNFYNPQFIPDQDGDSLPDILISNGGNVLAAPYDERNRHPGTLAVIGSRDGKLLARAWMPDKKETYMSVAVFPSFGEDDYQVIFGTGGETIGGSLYVAKLSDILRNDLSAARLLDRSPSKGYIGPPAWVDITGDGYPDIIANAVEGRLVAFDGKTYDPIWSVKVSDTEAYSSIAPGYFTDDDIPDFFVSYAIGQWPKLEFCKQVLVDGASGRITWKDSLGFYQTSTPVVADLNADGRDEALLSINIGVYEQPSRRVLYNIIASLDFAVNDVSKLAEPVKGSNISSTPWIGDLDGDNLLDIVYCHGTNPQKTYSFDGMQVHRIATAIAIRRPLVWGAYMGSRYDGVFVGSSPPR